MAIIPDEFHPVCLHRALDALPLLLMLASMQNAVYMSTKVMLLKILRKF